MTLLSIKNLRKSFGDTLVLKDISLSVARGESIAVLGANGSGKSTLLSCIAGLLRPDSGEILFSDATRGSVGILCQDNYFLYKELSVERNLQLYGTLLELDKTKERIEIALQRFGLSKLRKKKVRELSGGLQKRLALARTFLIEPKLLVLDEPSEHLDVDGKDMLIAMLLDHRESGGGAIVSTHDRELVLGSSSNMHEIRAGRILGESLVHRRGVGAHG